MKKTFTFCLLALLMAVQLNARNKSIPREKRQHWLNLSLGTASVTAKDISVSPNVYHGLNFMSGIGQEGRKSGQLGILNAGFQFGRIKYSYGNAQHQSNYRFNIDVIRSWEVRKGHTTHLYVGPMYSFLAAVRLPSEGENNFITYDVANSLGASGIAERGFRLLRRDWLIRYRLDMPVLSYLIRPSYTGPYPSAYLKNGTYDDAGQVGAGDAIKSGKLETFNHFFMLDSYLSLTYPLKKNNNALRLSYNWNFYTSSLHDKPASIGSQALLFSLLINL